MKREHPSDEQLRVQALERYFAAMRARDWEGLAACLSPGLRRSGPYRDVIEGVRPYLEYLSKVLASLSNHALEVARIRTLGDRSAVVELSESVDGDGARQSFPEVLLFDFDEQGLIVGIDIYLKPLAPPDRR